VSNFNNVYLFTCPIVKTVFPPLKQCSPD